MLACMHARARFAAGGLAALSAALVAAAPAPAAYAPQFSFKIDPATADTAAAITSTVTQAVGETPSKTVTVTLPTGFTPNAGSKLGVCSADLEAALACPAESKMGSASATVSAFGLTPTLSGPVYFGGPSGRSFRLIVVLADPAIGNQKLIGISTLRDDGAIETVFDNLPPFLATAFTLTLDGGDRALVKTPAKCGTLPVSAAFVSQTGETATGSAPTAITGCTASGTAPGTTGSTTGSTSPSAPALRIGAAKLARAGTVTFTLSAPARVTVTVTRAGRRVAKKTVTGRRGTNRVRLGRRVRAGRYRVALAAADASGRTVRRTTAVRLR